MSTRRIRQQIAEDTVARTPSIVSSTPGASLDSVFIKEQLPPLNREQCPNFPPTTVRVVNADSFTAAREILRDPEASKTAVLNLASDEERGGGWTFSLSKTQEEALCYSSTLYETLKEEYYPWPNLGRGSVAGVFSPAIVIFKDDLDHDCVDLPADDRRIVSVITVAAPCLPQLNAAKSAFANAEELEDLRGKIKLVYRMAAHNKQHSLVLGAMGCGAYRCPPRQVANEMKSILSGDEFKGWFRDIVFAVYSTASTDNFAIFQEVMKDFVV